MKRGEKESVCMSVSMTENRSEKERGRRQSMMSFKISKNKTSLYPPAFPVKMCSNGLAVMTSALHAEGCGFDLNPPSDNRTTRFE